MKSRTIERGISCLLFIAIVISLMTWWDAWNLAHKRDVSAGWPNPTISVRNSACPARTGVFLVACDYRGNFIHYSDLSAKMLSPEDQLLIGDMGRATDDIGQAFFLNMVAAVTGEPQRATKVGQINFFINLTGLLLLWILVFRFGGLIGNFALLIFGLISVNEKIVVPWHSLVEFFINTTSLGNFFGVSILAILPALALIEITKSTEARRPTTKPVSYYPGEHGTRGICHCGDDERIACDFGICCIAGYGAIPVEQGTGVAAGFANSGLWFDLLSNS